MKTWRKFKAHTGIKGKEQAYAADASPTGNDPEPVCPHAGLTQENYINPALLKAGMFASITNMSLVGLWL